MNGIGGRSIAEAKNCLSYSEAVSWSLYIRKYGTLNLSRRLERGFAFTCSMIGIALGSKMKMEDYILLINKPDPEDSIKGQDKQQKKGASIKDVFSLFSKLGGKSKK